MAFGKRGVTSISLVVLGAEIFMLLTHLFPLKVCYHDQSSQLSKICTVSVRASGKFFTKVSKWRG